MSAAGVDRPAAAALEDPALALVELSRLLAAEGGVLAPHLVDPEPAPALGLLVAAGPHGAERPGEYALVIEAVREGYLLHYGSSRLLGGHDPDLGLLAGDYMYALGIERLAALGDATTVALLGDLITLAALCHSEALERVSPALWLAFTVAIGAGKPAALEHSVQALRALESGAEQALREVAEITAQDSGMGAALRFAAKAIDFPAVN